MTLSTGTKAQKYWLEFEKLSLALIEDQFVTEPTSFCLTRASQDGGFDGDVLVEISGKPGFNFSFRALFEAKLRSGTDGVGLRTFAATLVVAHNAQADALIIVSNQSYTPQAVAEVARFAHATRMRVRLVNGSAVSGWVRRSHEKLLTQGYAEEFLDWLMEADPEALPDSTYEIPLPSSGQHFDDAVAHLSISTDEHGKLDCLIEISEMKKALPEIVGTQRVALVKQLSRAMNSQQGVAVFEGPSGAGKSFLLSHAMAAIGRGKNASRLDLSLANTPNLLFLVVFQRLTGIELGSLLVHETSEQQIARVLKAALGETSSPEFLNAVAAVIVASDQRGKERADLNRSYLAEYLGKAAKAQAKFSPFLLVCENSNKATSEVLDFLLAIIDQITPHGVVVIELRTDGDAQRTSPADWVTFQALFRNSATIGVLQAPLLSPSDAFALVEHHLPGLGIKRAEVICGRVGYSPFLIEIACLWLRQEQIVRRTDDIDESFDAGTIVHDLELFFEGITPQQATLVIDRLVEFWASHAEPIYQQAIISAALMDGILPLAWLRRLSDQHDEAELAHQLMQTGVFEHHSAMGKALRLRHDLLRERCAVFIDRKFLVTEKIAARLYLELDDVYPKGVLRDRFAALLALRTGAVETAFELSRACAHALEIQGQLSGASAMWEVAADAAERHREEGPLRDQRIADALLGYLQMENERNRLQLDMNHGRLAALENHAKLSTYLSGDNSLAAKINLLRWRRLFLLEQFDDAYAVTTELQLESDGLDEQMQAHVLSALAMNHKGAGRRTDAQNQFDLAVTRFPHIAFLQRNRLSNIASAHLDSDPHSSLVAYLEIRQLLQQEATPTLRESLHLDVDFAMAHFLAGNYDEALLRAEVAMESALSNAFETQEARARNIAACCHWVRQDLSKAVRQIELAVFAAERSYYYRFLWRMRVNAAGIAADREDWPGTQRHALAAVQRITEPRLAQFTDAKVRRQRWYAGLLAALHALEKSVGQEHGERQIVRLKLPYLSSDMQALRGGEWPAEVFDGRKHVHAGRIMITG